MTDRLLNEVSFDTPPERLLAKNLFEPSFKSTGKLDFLEALRFPKTGNHISCIHVVGP